MRRTRFREIERNVAALMRLDVGQLDFKCVNRDAVFRNFADNVQVIIGRQEIQLVGEGKAAVGIESRANRTDDVFVFSKAGRRGAVGIDQTIHAEIAVVQNLSKVAAISVDWFAVDGIAHQHRMIAPFPDKPAAEVGVLHDQLPVFFGITGTVAHCMDVFAKNDRLFVFAVFTVITNGL